MTSLLKQAKKEALKSKAHFRLGAVIAHKRKPLAKGRNHEKTHTCSSETLFQTLHAEMAALLQAKGLELKGATIYVIRVGKDNESFKEAKPCKVCWSLIQRSGIKTVYHTTSLGTVERIRVA